MTIKEANFEGGRMAKRCERSGLEMRLLRRIQAQQWQTRVGRRATKREEGAEVRVWLTAGKKRPE